MFTLQFGSYTFPNTSFEVKKFTIVNDIKSDRIPRAHGAKIQSPFIRERKIQVSGQLHTSTQAATETQLIALQQALLAGGEQKFQKASDKYISCYCEKIDPDPQDGTDQAVLDVDIDLVAQNPFFYSAGASYSFSGAIPKGTSNFSVSNGGNVFSEPVFSFYVATNTITDGISIINLTNNKTMKFRGTVTPGTTLQINCETLQVLNNGVDGMSWFEGDFITLEAGSNSFQFVGLTNTFKLDWKYRWY